jgi:hypothetical protein
MTIPPLQSGGVGQTPFRIPLLTAPVATGVPPLVGDAPRQITAGTPEPVTPTAARGDAPITLAGRLDAGDLLPDVTHLALALEAATRALQHGRADEVLAHLDAVWSQQLASDSPWYLRAAALELLGRVGDAEQVLRDAIARLPRSAAMLYLLGVHAAVTGQHDAAKLANDHALALHPTEPLLWAQRVALAQRDEPADTVHTLRSRLLSLTPADTAEQWVSTLTTPAPVDGALRFGLGLLDSPSQAAKQATTLAVPPDINVAYAPLELPVRSVHSSSRPPLPFEAVVIIVAGVVAVLIASLRVPALLIGGIAAMSLISRTRD